MTILPEERCYTVKNMADPLCFVCLTNQHTSFGEIISDGLVLSLLEKERRRNQRNIIKPGFA